MLISDGGVLYDDVAENDPSNITVAERVYI